MKRLYNTYKDDFDPEIAKNPLILTFDDLCYEIYEQTVTSSFEVY